ncbi:MAG TPA: nucleotide exchange factor GrpE [Thermoanaerobaculia bacterium]|nr:nucleotide exchange factor GrpE [Thermoanaerobaculia bacterium]
MRGKRDHSRGPIPDPPADPGTIEVNDHGETLEAVLEQEEQSAIASAEEKLRSARKDLDDLKDRHLRKLAEFDNMRKRGEREKSEYFRFALGNFLLDLFPISDSFDRALSHAPAEALETDFGQGVAMIRRQIDELWKKYGVVEVDTSGTFDPNVHEAVATEATDEEPKDAILEVLRKGYYLNDKLLRPALVKVAVPLTREE